MTATSPCSETSRRSQAEKKHNCRNCMKSTTTGARHRAGTVLKGKPLHPLKFFLITCKTK